MVTTIFIIIAIVIIAIIAVGIKINERGKLWAIIYIVLCVVLLIGLYYAWNIIYFAANWG